jgi:glycine betaine/proline transport system permease protein
MSIPRVPLGTSIEVAVGYVTKHFSHGFESIAAFINGVEFLARWLYVDSPPLVVAGAIIAFSYWGQGVRAAGYAAAGLLLIGNLQLWHATMETLALMSTAVLLTLAVGIPLGIAAGLSKRLEAVFQPVLDFLQTMHPFVYLIPVVIIFGIGVVPAILATVIYLTPVPIRLTCLGLRQVPAELVEAGEAFGCDRRQLLMKVLLPMSYPSIMAGVNQTIMLALGMVVICALIGAGGLGAEIVRGISRMDLPMGFEGGIAVVIVAILLDGVGRGVGRRAFQSRWGER